MTNRNPILDELRKTREVLLANAGGTMAGLVAQLQEDERKSGRTVLDADALRRKRRAIRNTDVAKGIELPVEHQISNSLSRNE